MLNPVIDSSLILIRIWLLPVGQSFGRFLRTEVCCSDKMRRTGS